MKRRHISARELVDEAYAAIERENPKLSAFITLRDKADAQREAVRLDRETELRPLHGIPFCAKDAYMTEGLRTTAGSKVLETFAPPFDATVIRHLRDAGGILIGKTNMDAWGHGGSTENSDFGVTSNPYDRRYVAGGSSGGSAAAVAVRASMFSIAEDTGGSIRNPASMCNVTGLKVTYGLVSRFGMISYASSLDTVGPIAKSADDIAHVLEAIAGPDPKDATSSHRPVPKYSKLLKQPVKGLRLGIPEEAMHAGIDTDVRRVFDEALAVLGGLGVKTIPVRIPSLCFSVPMYYLIAMSETSSNLARFDGVRFGRSRKFFSEETMRRIIVGTYALKAGYQDELYVRALKGRTILIREFDELWKSCDALVCPTLPGLPHKRGDIAREPLKMLLADSLTVPANLIGSPALALPAGFSRTNLPVGIQLVGKRFNEAALLSLGHAFQRATDWHMRKPNA